MRKIMIYVCWLKPGCLVRDSCRQGLVSNGGRPARAAPRTRTEPHHRCDHPPEPSRPDGFINAPPTGSFLLTNATVVLIWSCAGITSRGCRFFFLYLFISFYRCVRRLHKNPIASFFFCNPRVWSTFPLLPNFFGRFSSQTYGQIWGVTFFPWCLISFSIFL